MKLPINQIKLNPNNPRIIKDDKYKKLVQSLKDFPEMAEVREIVVNKDYVILGGNMRFRAMQEAGWKEVPVKVVDWPEEKQREFIIKDNASLGEWDWDILANEWEDKPLLDWGVEIPPMWGSEDTAESQDKEGDPKKKMFAAVIVAFDNIEDLDKLTSLYELDSIDITEDIKTQIALQRKVYVFRK